MLTTSGTYPWSFVTQIFHNGQPSHGGDRKISEVFDFNFTENSSLFKTEREKYLQSQFVAKQFSVLFYPDIVLLSRFDLKIISCRDIISQPLVHTRTHAQPRNGAVVAVIVW